MSKNKSIEDHMLLGNPSKLSPAQIEFRQAAEKATPTLVPKPKLKPEDIVVPPDLDAVAAKKYREVVAGEIFDDLESAELYARTWSQKADADEDVRANGRMVDGERGWKANPAVKESLALGVQLSKLLAQRGRRKQPPESVGQKYLKLAIARLEEGEEGKEKRRWSK